MSVTVLSFFFRWAKLRGAMCPHLLFFEPISECMVLGILAAWSAHTLFGFDPLSFFLVHLLCWFLLDWSLLRIVQNGALPFNKFEFLVSEKLFLKSYVIYKKGVISDPLGQTLSLACSEHGFLLKFVLFWKVGMDGRHVTTVGRPRGSIYITNYIACCIVGKELSQPAVTVGRPLGSRNHSHISCRSCGFFVKSVLRTCMSVLFGIPPSSGDQKSFASSGVGWQSQWTTWKWKPNCDNSNRAKDYTLRRLFVCVLRKTVHRHSNSKFPSVMRKFLGNKTLNAVRGTQVKRKTVCMPN